MWHTALARPATFQRPTLPAEAAEAPPVHRNHPDSFRGIQLRGMEQDLTWDNAAAQYEEVFVAAKYQW